MRTSPWVPLSFAAAAVLIAEILAHAMTAPSPEPFMLPPSVAATTPLDTRDFAEDASPVIVNVSVQWPTVQITETPTPHPIAPKATTFVETLPICDSTKTPGGTLCAPIRVPPVPTPTPYQECNDQSYHDTWGVVKPCIKPDPTQTP
jgi:hypothetical protein